VDTATLLGLALGFIGVVGGNIMEGGSPTALINIPGFMIVVLGSLGAGITAFPMETVKAVPKLLGKAFKQQTADTAAVVPWFEQMADKARREGLLSLEEEGGKIDDAFLRKGLQLIIDGTDPEALRSILATEIGAMEERHHRGERFLEAVGGFAPTLGVLGAIMGLISVLSHLDDTERLGEGIAVAFVASFYGVFTANLIWLPLANKLKVKSQEEVQLREAMLEGLLAIQAGDNPRIVKDKLEGYLAPALRGRAKAAAAEEAAA
jgi:chemotaxis protein MotA